MLNILLLHDPWYHSIILCQRGEVTPFPGGWSQFPTRPYEQGPDSILEVHLRMLDPNLIHGNSEEEMLIHRHVWVRNYSRLPSHITLHIFYILHQFCLLSPTWGWKTLFHPILHYPSTCPQRWRLLLWACCDGCKGEGKSWGATTEAPWTSTSRGTARGETGWSL